MGRGRVCPAPRVSCPAGVTMNAIPETDGAPLVAALRADHHRVLALFRPLADSRDDFERIEMVSVICEEIRQLLRAERSVLRPLVATAAAPTDTGRDTELLTLTERLESLSPEESSFDRLSLHAYDRLRDYLCAQERELFPLLARLDASALARAEQRLRDLRERVLEH